MQLKYNFYVQCRKKWTAFNIPEIVKKFINIKGFCPQRFQRKIMACAGQKVSNAHRMSSPVVAHNMMIPMQVLWRILSEVLSLRNVVTLVLQHHSQWLVYLSQFLYRFFTNWMVYDFLDKFIQFILDLNERRSFFFISALFGHFQKKIYHFHNIVHCSKKFFCIMMAGSFWFWVYVQKGFLFFGQREVFCLD